MADVAKMKEKEVWWAQAVKTKSAPPLSGPGGYDRDASVPVAAGDSNNEPVESLPCDETGASNKEPVDLPARVEDLGRHDTIASVDKATESKAEPVESPSMKSLGSEEGLGKEPRSSRGVFKSDLVPQHASCDFLDSHFDVEIEELGAGAYGRVKLVSDKKTGEKRVCKLVSTQGLEPKTLEMMKKEVDMLCELDHPNVVKIFAHAFDEASGELVIVLEYLKGGDCASLLERASGQPLCEELVGMLVQQALTALCYCHAQDVVHRDVKPENLMLIERVEIDASVAHCKLIDFGVSASGEGLKRGLFGTPSYMAPDVAVFHNKRLANKAPDQTPKADIWSLGVSAFQLLIDESPFDDERKEDIIKALLKYSSFKDISKKFIHLPVWRLRSADGFEFLKALLVADPTKRPTAAEALDHPWIQARSPRRGMRSSLGPELVQGLMAYQDAPPVVRCCLYIVAARLGVSDLERFGATFLRLDKNHDGSIGVEELASGLSEMEGGSSIDLDCVLDAADLDHSGDIGFTEFVAACLCARHVSQGSIGCLLEEAFEALDDDRDGLVTLQQLHGLFRERDAPSFASLPQDRPFDVDEWSSCLRNSFLLKTSASTSLDLDVPMVPPQSISEIDFSKITMR